MPMHWNWNWTRARADADADVETVGSELCVMEQLSSVNLTEHEWASKSVEVEAIHHLLLYTVQFV